MRSTRCCGRLCNLSSSLRRFCDPWRCFRGVPWLTSPASGSTRKVLLAPAPTIRTDSHLGRQDRFLDVGPTKYGDAAIVSFGNRHVLIDGAHPGRQTGDARHPSLPDQIAETTGGDHVDLIVVSHTHRDYFGCLPHLITNGMLTADSLGAVSDVLIGDRAPAPRVQSTGSSRPRLREILVNRAPLQ